MNTVLKIASALAMAASVVAAIPAVAAETELKSHMMITSADGARVGKIEYLVKGEDGAPTAAKVIVDGRFVSIPVSSLTTSDKGVTTSLTKNEVRKLK